MSTIGGGSGGGAEGEIVAVVGSFHWYLLVIGIVSGIVAVCVIVVAVLVVLRYYTHRSRETNHGNRNTRHTTIDTEDEFGEGISRRKFRNMIQMYHTHDTGLED